MRRPRAGVVGAALFLGVWAGLAAGCAQVTGLEERYSASGGHSGYGAAGGSTASAWPASSVPTTSNPSTDRVTLNRLCDDHCLRVESVCGSEAYTICHFLCPSEDASDDPTSPESIQCSKAWQEYVKCAGAVPQAGWSCITELGIEAVDDDRCQSLQIDWIKCSDTPGCNNDCDSSIDGSCDDGGAGSKNDRCALGSDCEDCGDRSARIGGLGTGGAAGAGDREP